MRGSTRQVLALATALLLACSGCANKPQQNDTAASGEPAAAATEAEGTAEEEESNAAGGEDQKALESESQSQNVGCGTYVGTTPDSAQPYIKEACWWTTEDQNGTYINVATLMGNTDTVNCYVYPAIEVVAYGEDGSILGTEKVISGFIAPDDVMPGLTTISVASWPARVEFDITYDEGMVPGNPYTLASFTIENTSEQEVNDLTRRWTGQYTNGCGVDFTSGCDAYVLLRRNGQLVAGYNDMSVDQVDDGSTNPFSITMAYAKHIPEYDSFEFYIVPNLV